jgi:hypothetical protein
MLVKRGEGRMRFTRRLRRTSLTLAILLVLAFNGCQLFSPLHPPSWIIGTWADVGLNTDWIFTSDNAVWSMGTTTFDFKQMRSTGVQVSDTETSTSYTVSMGSGGVSQNYTFEKGDGTFITWVDMGTQLFKQ